MNPRQVIKILALIAAIPCTTFWSVWFIGPKMTVVCLTIALGLTAVFVLTGRK